MPRYRWYLIFFIFILAACQPTTLPSAEAPGATAALSPTESPTLTPEPTSTPQPGLVILWMPENARLSLQDRLVELSQEKGLRFESKTTLSQADLTPEVKIVIAVEAGETLAELAASAPAIEFLALGNPALTAGSNLSVLGEQAVESGEQAFIAGYLSALIAEDWRAGVITNPLTPDSPLTRQAFRNGLVFFCGLCRPAYPPYVEYPIYLDISDSTNPESLKVIIDTLVAQAVNVVYVSPQAGSPALFESLGQAGIKIIGATIPEASLQTNWVASVRVDLLNAFNTAWIEITNDRGGTRWEAPLVVDYRNPDLISPGRQRLLDELLQGLQAGWIGVGVTP